MSNLSNNLIRGQLERANSFLSYLHHPHYAGPFISPGLMGHICHDLSGDRDSMAVCRVQTVLGDAIEQNEITTGGFDFAAIPHPVHASWTASITPGERIQGVGGASECAH